MSFALYPAIDLRRGRCVRLERGAAERETVYEDNPLSLARHFAEAGAEWVHVVDLDAAFGDGSNRELIRAIAHLGAVKVQTGGGLRQESDLEEILDAGAARAVIGTAAIEDPDLVRSAIDRWGAERIAVGLDARGVRPAVRGWREEVNADLFVLGQSLAQLGVEIFIYTDIERDGMLRGPNVAMAVELAERTGANVIVSGGVASLDDISTVAEAAATRRGVSGVILGKALYEGRVDLSSALRIAHA